MIFFLTSFRKAVELDETVWDIWSSAVYQPHWLPQRPKAKWMDIRPDFKGTWIRPREFIEMDYPLDGYFDTLATLYDSRQPMINEWLASLPDKDIAICCWCPYDKAAQRQLEEHGTFVCHTAAVGSKLESMGLWVDYDNDRERMVMP